MGISVGVGGSGVTEGVVVDIGVIVADGKTMNEQPLRMDNIISVIRILKYFGISSPRNSHEIVIFRLQMKNNY